jgi:hypothetical protein
MPSQGAMLKDTIFLRVQLMEGRILPGSIMQGLIILAMPNSTYLCV